jgi:hypothetical protein
MRAYSLDLREKVVESVNKGAGLHHRSRKSSNVGYDFDVSEIAARSVSELAEQPPETEATRKIREEDRFIDLEHARGVKRGTGRL